jgi:hypothetical protein
MRHVTLFQVRDYLHLDRHSHQCSQVLELGTGNKYDHWSDFELIPAEVLFLQCYCFIEQNATGMWHEWHPSIWDLCETAGKLLTDHLTSFSPDTDPCYIRGLMLAIVDGRYITFTDSKLYYDTKLMEECKAPKSPPVVVTQLMLISAFMKILKDHEVVKSNTAITS